MDKIQKKGIIVLGIFVVLIASAFFIEGEEYVLNDVTAEEYLSLVESEDKNIFYIGSANCSHCTRFKPVLNSVVGEYGLTVSYREISDHTEDQYYAFMDSLDFYQEEKWGTPLLLVVEDGEVVDSLIGEASANTVEEFFITNGFIREEE